MEVGSMTEFLERLEQDDNERQHKEEKKLKVRKYLLVDRRKFNFLKCKCNKDGANEEQAIWKDTAAIAETFFSYVMASVFLKVQFAPLLRYRKQIA